MEAIETIFNLLFEKSLNMDFNSYEMILVISCVFIVMSIRKIMRIVSKKDCHDIVLLLLPFIINFVGMLLIVGLNIIHAETITVKLVIEELIICIIKSGASEDIVIVPNLSLLVTFSVKSTVIVLLPVPVLEPSNVIHVLLEVATHVLAELVFILKLTFTALTVPL